MVGACPRALTIRQLADIAELIESEVRFHASRFRAANHQLVDVQQAYDAYGLASYFSSQGITSPALPAPARASGGRQAAAAIAGQPLLPDMPAPPGAAANQQQPTASNQLVLARGQELRDKEPPCTYCLDKTRRHSPGTALVQ